MPPGKDIQGKLARVRGKPRPALHALERGAVVVLAGEGGEGAGQRGGCLCELWCEELGM